MHLGGAISRLAAVLLAAGGLSAPAGAQAFPEHFLSPPVEHALGPYRDELVEALAAASKAKKHHEGIGDLYDPAPMAALMAPAVEIFIASRQNSAAAEFKLLGRYAPLEALATLGRLSGNEHAESVVMQRYGMQIVGDTLADRAIGPAGWLGGRECTAAYGKIDQMAFVDLVRDTGFAPATWHVVLPGEGGGAPWGEEIEPWLLVSLEDLGARNMSYWALHLPGGRSLEFHHSGWGFERLAPYLTSHACFDLTAEGMRLTAIAIRLD
jgi:hypothetical protein